MAKYDTIIIKIASRCNINCTYCYMYNLGDSSYALQPKFISEKTIDSIYKEVKRHCKKNEITKFTFIFHGGEPLLMKKKEFKKMINIFNSLKLENIDVVFALQTNGILIDKEWCEIFDEFNIGVGISLDGKKEINDLNRVDKKGNGSYDDVIKGISVLKKYFDKEFGLLSVVNIDADPVESYQHLKNCGAATVDFLLLDANFDNADTEIIDNNKNADWFIKVFDEWYNEPEETRIQYRFFEVIIHKILGGLYSIDNMGYGDNTVLVIETNGEIEAVDVLKICGESFTKTNININTNSFDEVFNNVLAEIYYNSGKYLAKKCLACPINEICGGGYLPHRYSSLNGFNNPSVYCNDLLKLITHIQNRIVDSLPEKIKIETGIEKLSYENALEIINITLTSIKEPDYIEKLESFSKKEFV